MKHAAARNRAAAALAGAALTAAATGQSEALEMTPIPSQSWTVDELVAGVELDFDRDGVFDTRLQYVDDVYGDIVRLWQLNSQQHEVLIDLSLGYATYTFPVLASKSSDFLLDAAARYTERRVFSDDAFEARLISDVMILNGFPGDHLAAAQPGTYVIWMYAPRVSDRKVAVLDFVGTYESDPTQPGRDVLTGLVLAPGSFVTVLPEPTSITALGVMSLFALRRRRRG